MRRLKCGVARCKYPEHGVQTVPTPWTGKHSRITLFFDAFAIRVMLVCCLLGLSWRQGYEIRKRTVERGLAQRENNSIDYVGIDEKSFGKGYDYGSILTDLRGKRVREVKAGRKQESANELLETLTQDQREGIFP